MIYAGCRMRPVGCRTCRELARVVHPASAKSLKGWRQQVRAGAGSFVSLLVWPVALWSWEIRLADGHRRLQAVACICTGLAMAWRQSGGKVRCDAPVPELRIVHRLWHRVAHVRAGRSPACRRRDRDNKKTRAMAGFLSDEIVSRRGHRIWCPGEDSNLHGFTR